MMEIKILQESTSFVTSASQRNLGAQGRFIIGNRDLANNYVPLKTDLFKPFGRRTRLALAEIADIFFRNSVVCGKLNY